MPTRLAAEFERTMMLERQAVIRQKSRDFDIPECSEKHGVVHSKMQRKSSGDRELGRRI